MSMLQPAIFSRGAVDKMAGNILLRNALADQCTVFGITHDYALGEQGQGARGVSILSFRHHFTITLSFTIHHSNCRFTIV